MHATIDQSDSEACRRGSGGGQEGVSALLKAHLREHTRPRSGKGYHACNHRSVKQRGIQEGVRRGSVGGQEGVNALLKAHLREHTRPRSEKGYHACNHRSDNEIRRSQQAMWQSVGREYTSNNRWNIRNAVLYREWYNQIVYLCKRQP
eukprot:1192463-Prorocentrum_minimum.AAC.1